VPTRSPGQRRTPCALESRPEPRRGPLAAPLKWVWIDATRWGPPTRRWNWGPQGRGHCASRYKTNLPSPSLAMCSDSAFCGSLAAVCETSGMLPPRPVVVSGPAASGALGAGAARAGDRRGAPAPRALARAARGGVALGCRGAERPEVTCANSRGAPSAASSRSPVETARSKRGYRSRSDSSISLRGRSARPGAS